MEPFPRSDPPGRGHVLANSLKNSGSERGRTTRVDQRMEDRLGSWHLIVGCGANYRSIPHRPHHRHREEEEEEEEEGDWPPDGSVIGGASLLNHSPLNLRGEGQLQCACAPYYPHSPSPCYCSSLFLPHNLVSFSTSDLLHCIINQL